MKKTISKSGMALIFGLVLISASVGISSGSRSAPASLVSPDAALSPASLAQTVSFIIDPACEDVSRHGLKRLEDAFRGKGLSIESAASTDRATGQILVVAGLASSGGGPAVRLLREDGVSLPAVPEALTVRRSRKNGREFVVLCGADERGLMYAALDTADRIGWSRGAADVLDHVRSVTEKPDLTDRSISIYTMQRRYFESRLFDEAYWESYFDTLARNRFNSFVVIFGYENGGFMAPPYPYFFDVEGFPDVRLAGLTAEEQIRNRKAFQRMIKIAHSHGVRFTAGIWDHIYRAGVQAGGVSGADRIPEAPTPGLVWGVTAANLYAYSQAAIKKFIEIFPDLDALQFRMHNESGLKNEEVVGFWHEVFTMIKKVRPGLNVDVRAKELPDAVIDDGLAQGLRLRVTTKFWMEQMGLPFHPTHINTQDQKNRRHGYADLLRYPQRYKIHWRLWNGGTSRILLWGDPDYVRTFVRSAHLYDGDSFEVNEPLATKMLAQPHDQAPFELLNPENKYYTWEFERYWHFFQVFGRLAYNPDTPAEVWDREFAARFGGEAGPYVARGLHLASRILPRIVAAVYPYGLFPTTVGWAEKMRLGDLPQFAKAQGSDIQQFAGFAEEAARLIEGRASAKRSPLETARWFSRTSDEILAQIAGADRLIGDKANKEYISTRTDLQILAHLAGYYARRIPAALSYALFVKTQDRNALDDALAGEKNAVEAWERLVTAAGRVYADDLMMGNRRFGLSGHWKDELAALKAGLAKLEEERLTSRPDVKPAAPRIAQIPARGDADSIRGTASGDREPPAVQHTPVTAAKAGEPLAIALTVKDPSGVAWVRLRYRHLTQFEDYETIEMASDASTSGLFRAVIPAAFVVDRWDLMYFFEVMDNQGNGAIYPDLDKDIPYLIVKLRR